MFRCSRNLRRGCDLQSLQTIQNRDISCQGENELAVPSIAANRRPVKTPNNGDGRNAPGPDPQHRLPPLRIRVAMVIKNRDEPMHSEASHERISRTCSKLRYPEYHNESPLKPIDSCSGSITAYLKLRVTLALDSTGFPVIEFPSTRRRIFKVIFGAAGPVQKEPCHEEIRQGCCNGRSEGGYVESAPAALVPGDLLERCDR